jgi:hypothetical protein
LTKQKDRAKVVNMRDSKVLVLAKKLLISAVLMACSANLYSQQTDRLITVRKLAVKPDKLEKFTALQKEMSEAWESAGRGRRWVWRQMDGDSHTFHIISEIGSFSERGGSQLVMDQAHLNLWLDAVGETIRSREFTTYRRELAIPALDRPNFVVVNERTIRRGRITEYLDWVENRFIPVARKYGLSGMIWDRLMYGGNSRTVVNGRFIDSWAELDEPMLNLSEDERIQLFEGTDEFFEGDGDRYVMRFEEEMSTGTL